MNSILQFDAIELRRRLAEGSLRAIEIAEACLEEVERREPDVQAWTWLDPEHVRRQAKALDEYRASGRAIGALHGLPVGIKDIIDTAGISTENGTAIDAGRVPTEDAFVVTRLKQAGALIMGKTVTTELANRAPGKTRNPHNAAHTPGGSSSGSAAAVAAGMIPFAIGTQTAGSVVRPASYCGVVGYKPTFGTIPRTGVLVQASSLDTMGVFARTVEEAAMLADPLFGYDPGDAATAPVPSAGLFDVARSDPPVKPTLAFVRQAAWQDADPETWDAFAELVGALGEDCDEIELPAPFDRAGSWHAVVHRAEMSKAYHRYEERGQDRLSDDIRSALDEGKRILARDYLAARDWSGVLNDTLDAVFTRYDAILTPAAPGPAPLGLSSTGSPAFNAIWSFCGTPAITVPLLQSEAGLPIGVQLVGRRGDDARLLRTARWLVEHLATVA